MLTTIPLCNFSLEFPELLRQNLIHAIIDWACLGIPKQCIVGYSLTCPIERWKLSIQYKILVLWEIITTYLWQMRLVEIMSKISNKARNLRNIVAEVCLFCLWNVRITNEFPMSPTSAIFIISTKLNSLYGALGSSDRGGHTATRDNKKNNKG